MATEQNLQLITVTAGADLSALQYTFVVMSDDGMIDGQTSAGGEALGILQNKPSAAGQAAVVAVGGISKCKYGATIDEDDKIQTTTAGAADVAATGDHVLARAIKAGASGDIGEVLLISQHVIP
jgi:hypothetical protein